MLVMEAYDIQQKPGRRLFKAMCVPEEGERELFRQLPQYGSPHPLIPGLTCAEIDAVRVLPTMFNVEVRYAAATEPCPHLCVYLSGECQQCGAMT